MERIAYARLFATVAGLVLVVLGLAGFAVSPGFHNPELPTDLLGFYPVNNWSASVCLGAGLVGLALARPLPRLFALLAGVFFLGLGIWGVFAPDGSLLFGVLPASRSVNLLNLILGGVGLIALAASRWDRIRVAAARWLERFRRSRERWKRQRLRRRASRRLAKERKSSRAPRQRSKGGGKSKVKPSSMSKGGRTSGKQADQIPKRKAE